MRYPFVQTHSGERDRLAALEGTLDSFSEACLKVIGVGPGWSCLEVGAGAGSIARSLCSMVGEKGAVVATDLETGLLAEVDAPNLEVRKHDIRKEAFPGEQYDLVHARKVLEHLPEPEVALATMCAAARPGGWILVEDADLLSIAHCSGIDPDFFRRAYRAFLRVMESNGFDPLLGLRLGDLLRAQGLFEVQMRGWTMEWSGAPPNRSLYVQTFERLRDQVVDRGLLSQDEATRFLSEIQSPSFRAITGVHFAAWGRRPAQPAEPSADAAHRP